MRSLGAEYSKAGDDGKAGAAASRGLTPRGSGGFQQSAAASARPTAAPNARSAR